MPSCALRSCSRLSTTACTETSSAAVGSSRISSSGCSAIARAMPTRAFWPPDSWWGKRSSRSTGRPTWRRQLLDSARASAARLLTIAEPQDRIGDGARRGEARIEAVGRVLEHHLEALAQRHARERSRPGWRRCPRRRSMIEPDVGSSRRITIAEVVDLPQPDSPTRPTLSPRAIVEADAVDGAERGLRFGCGFARGSCAEQLRPDGRARIRP